MPSLLFANFQLPGIPATMALAVVALIGYWVGRQSRNNRQAASEKLEQALTDARQLEQISDEMLSATREALDQCRQLRRHMPQASGVGRQSVRGRHQELLPDA